MFKVFAILAVFAALPVSALAEQVPLTKNAGIHCTRDQADQAYVSPSAPAPVAEAQKATAAR